MAIKIRPILKKQPFITATLLQIYHCLKIHPLSHDPPVKPFPQNSSKIALYLYAQGILFARLVDPGTSETSNTVTYHKS